MNKEIKEIINNITSMSDEERKEQLSWSDTHEFGTAYAYFLLEENQKLNKIIDELEKILKDVPNNDASNWQYGRESLAEDILDELTELKKRSGISNNHD